MYTPCAYNGQPEDVANLVNWLAGDEARYASGLLWVLNGGLTAVSPLNTRLLLVQELVQQELSGLAASNDDATS